MPLGKGMKTSRGISKKHAESLILNRKQISTLFANMLNDFTYNKIILDENGKPVDLITLEANNAFEKRLQESQLLMNSISLLFKWLRISVYSPKKHYFVALFEDITNVRN